MVSEKTGLTKKAIKYYESEGLICPAKNVDNNYREYTEEDLIKLNLIGALRALDIPVCEIKNVVKGQKSIPEVMKQALQRIHENIDHLEKSKMIITNLMEKNSKDYESIGEQVKKLKETLELSMEGKKEYIASTLLRLFPGRFGQVFVANYEPFLKVTVDSDEKKQAWLKLVEFLDDLEEVDENHPLIAGMDNNNGDALTYREQAVERVRKILNGDPEAKNEIKDGIISIAKNLKEDEAFRQNVKDNLEKAEDMVRTMGASHDGSDDIFVTCLETINDDYRKYRKIVNQIKEEAEQEIKDKMGLSFEEMIQNLK